MFQEQFSGAPGQTTSPLWALVLPSGQPPNPDSDPNISVGPTVAAPRAPSVSLGSTPARSWRTCFPSENTLDSVLTLRGTLGCSELGNLSLLHQQEAASSAEGCRPALPTSPPGPWAHGPQPVRGSNPRLSPQCALLRPPHVLRWPATLLCFLL